MGLENAVASRLPSGYEPCFFDVVAFIRGGLEVGCCRCLGRGGCFVGLAI